MNKTVLITGASRGIGAATAIAFARNGYNVAINYNKSEALAASLESRLRSEGANVIKVKADVSDQNQVISMTEAVMQAYGNINVLVNNAGIAQVKLFCDLSEEDWNRMFDINVKGIFLCTRAVLPSMIRQKCGKIINLSSIWGLVGASCEVHYSASKAAVMGLTKALAKELGPSGIQVNCVAPGVITTDMNSDLTEEAISAIKEETPLGVLGSPDDIAETILFLASEKANFITGQTVSPNGGFVI